MGVNCRLIACSRLRDNRARGIEKARTKKGRKLRRGGAAYAFHFPVSPTFSRLSHTLAPSGHYLRAWNRLVDTRHIELKRSQGSNISSDWHATLQAVGKERRLLVVLFAALDCTGLVRSPMFVTGRNYFFRFPFLSDHLTAMSYSLFRRWTVLFITPDILTANNHYSFFFKPCYYSLFGFHPEHLI